MPEKLRGLARAVVLLTSACDDPFEIGACFKNTCPYRRVDWERAEDLATSIDGVLNG